jgi:hypothetical protein
MIKNSNARRSEKDFGIFGRRYFKGMIIEYSKKS